MVLMSREFTLGASYLLLEIRSPYLTFFPEIGYAITARSGQKILPDPTTE